MPSYIEETTFIVSSHNSILYFALWYYHLEMSDIQKFIHDAINQTSNLLYLSHQFF